MVHMLCYGYQVHSGPDFPVLEIKANGVNGCEIICSAPTTLAVKG